MARVSRKNRNIHIDTPVLTNIKKVYMTGIYLRLSSEYQEDGSNHRLDNQEQVIRNYLNDRAEFQIAKVYCDNGYTGTNFKRDAFEELMTDVKAGKINCIVVKDLSRLGRNHIEVEQYLQVVFPFLKVRFIAVNDHFDSLEADGDITVSLKNIVNAAYAKDISRKIYSAKQVLMEKGMFVGNIPPYGYKRSKEEPHRLIVNEETSEIVKQIFELKYQRKKYAHIVNILNEMGEPAPMAYWYKKGVVHHEKYANTKWSIPTVRGILRNRVYVGDMVQGKHRQCLAEGRPNMKAQNEEDFIIVENTHEPMIGREFFAEVQEICNEELQVNREKRYRNDGLIDTDNLLGNLIYSVDGQKMYRTRNVYEDQRVTYGYITTKSIKPDGTYFPKYYMNETKVYISLREAIYMYIELLCSMQQRLKKKRVQRLIKQEKQSRTDERDNLVREIENYNKRGAELFKEMTSGLISFAEYEGLKQEYLGKKERASDQLKHLKKEDMTPGSLISMEGELDKQMCDFLKNKELTRELVELLVKRVTVLDKQKIHVVFKFEDEVKALYKKVKIGG